MGNYLKILAVAAALSACNPNVPVTQAICDELAKGDEAFIEAKAAELGLPVEVVHGIYVAACGPFQGDKVKAQMVARDAVAHASALFVGDAGVEMRLKVRR
jgi:hypothetical protein